MANKNIEKQSQSDSLDLPVRSVCTQFPNLKGQIVDCRRPGYARWIFILDLIPDLTQYTVPLPMYLLS